MKSNPAVSQYYRDVAFDYTVFWNLRGSMAMRIGLWDHDTRSVAEALTREDRFLAEEAAITSRDHVLDAGCGVGGSAIYLARTYGCRVTGLTESPDQARVARQNAQRWAVDDLVDFRTGDFHAIDCPDASFTVVWALESISHSPRKEELLAELFRVLAPGGRLIGADYFSTKTDYDPATHAMRRRIFEGLHFEPFAYAPFFRRCLNACGFSGADFFDVTAMALPSARRFSLLSRWGMGAAMVLQKLGLRTAAQNRLARGLQDQYRALADGVHEYRVFYAAKPVRTSRTRTAQPDLAVQEVLSV